jgi:hypothetical protein
MNMKPENLYKMYMGSAHIRADSYCGVMGYVLYMGTIVM